MKSHAGDYWTYPGWLSGQHHQDSITYHGYLPSVGQIFSPLIQNFFTQLIHIFQLNKTIQYYLLKSFIENSKVFKEHDY